MEENGTVQQLSSALNQLLDAYEKIKDLNTELKSDKELLENELDNLTIKNNQLEEQLSSLSNETQTNSSQMDNMLNRISSILDTPKEESKIEMTEETLDLVQEEENIESITEEEITNEVIENIVKEVEEIHNDEQNPTNDIPIDNPIKKEEPKSIDLGRMQSLLNGFNN